MSDLIICILICSGGGMAFSCFRKSSGRRMANCGQGAIYGAIFGLAFYFVSGVGGSAAMNQSTLNVSHITGKDFDADVIHSTKPVVMDFYATWCGPCKILSPRLDKLAGSFTNGIRFVKVNIDESQDLARQFDIREIPTLFFFKNGQVVRRITGLVSSEELKADLESLAGTNPPAKN